MPTFTGNLATVMTLVFYLIAIFYIIFSVIFYYHWTQYAVDKKVRNLTLLIYILTTLPLLAIMGMMLFFA